MQQRHTDRKQYFEELAATSRKHYVPLISRFHKLTPDLRVLEIGCGDGGNLLPLAEGGCRVTGVDISQTRIDDAGRFFAGKHVTATFIATDIFKAPDLGGPFDVILCHDVYEHIGDKRGFLEVIAKYLAPDGIAFIAFPAWQMPFGGHQQICHSRVASKLPFMHLLPAGAYRSLLKAFGENEDCIGELLSIKRTRATVEQFEKCVRSSGLAIALRELWLINPHYEVKFGLKARRLSGLIGAIPYVRNWFSSSCSYILRRNP